MRQYQHLLRQCYLGDPKTDRTGTGTTSIFGYQMRFDLAAGFPLLTTKKLHFKGIVHELLWILAGDTNIKYLVDNGVNIWNDWPLARYNRLHPRNMTMAEFTARIKKDATFAKSWGDLGPVYGKQWRAWDCYEPRETPIECGNGGSVAVEIHEKRPIDQMAMMLYLLKTDPDSRRMVVNAWNVADLPQMALSPCHCLFQFYVAEGKLSCQLYQRSADIFLGVPYNIASYALLTMMMAQVTGLRPGDLIWTGGDVHLYNNHREQAEELLGRVPKALPHVVLDAAVTDLFEFREEHVTLVGYDPDPSIKAPVAV